ncbi:g11238 [Coccomyxa elongata]
MVRFGEYLDQKQRSEWRPHYLDYKGLKDLIKEAQQEMEQQGTVAFSPRTTSLTVTRPRGQKPADERFFEKLENEVTKINKFTQNQVSSLKKRLKALRDQVRDAKDSKNSTLTQEAKEIGDEFLALEKYVNLNYLGFHKILKKHDKVLPHAPCQQFYVAHLHHQPWVQGNYSDLLVQLSNIYSQLRGDVSGVKNEDSAQGFVRSTTKYWVRMTDVSAVKHHILQHLPVFQYNEGSEDQSDSQLINSVYLDNSSMELYHGRLDKRPNAIAIRIRWYGDGDPKTCFVERKTHRESWKGEESVKERFTLPEHKMVPFLEGEYTLGKAVADLEAKGKSETEIANFSKLFAEIQQQIDTKQLRPMIRTQYLRTAFQIPFDSTVRISLDTNLNMIKENPDDGPTCTVAGRWYRDPTLPVPRTEVTRFPHGVLEVKLSLPEGQQAPEWVQDLLDSGYLTEVHKFSKFIHGTATLLPELVQAVPYWVDDESVRPSMLQSAPQPAQAVPGAAAPAPAAAGIVPKPRRRTGNDSDELQHPLLGDQPTLQLLPPRDAVGFGRKKEKKGFFDWYFNSRKAKDPPVMARTTPMRIEPKTFFANERTFLSWLHMAVTIGSIAAALLGFVGVADSSKHKQQATDYLVETIALILLPVAVLMCAYALTVFIWRARAIAKKQVGYIDDRFGPLGLAAVVVLALTAILIISVIDFVEQMKGDKGPPPGPPAPLGPLSESASLRSGPFGLQRAL